MLKILFLSIALPGIAFASQSVDTLPRSLDDVMASNAGIKTNVKNVLGDLNLAVKVAVEPVPIPGAENPVWWVIEGQNSLSEEGEEVFARPGEIVVCSEVMGDCNVRYRVKIEDGINLSKVAAKLKDKNFETQMLQLSDLARRPPQISVTNEGGRIMLRTQQ